MSKTFLFQASQFSRTVLIQTIQFRKSIVFVYTQLDVKQFSLAVVHSLGTCVNVYICVRVWMRKRARTCVYVCVCVCEGERVFNEMYIRVFANGPGDLGSIPGRVIPKTQKMVLDASLLNTQHCKVRIKGKVEQHTYLIQIFIIQRVKARAILCRHQPQIRLITQFR